jgi:hypothetical protein
MSQARMCCCPGREGAELQGLDSLEALNTQPVANSGQQQLRNNWQWLRDVEAEF